jgi:hypothetical protein
VGTVKSRLHRGRVALAKAMGIRGGPEGERADAPGSSEGTIAP